MPYKNKLEQNRYHSEWRKLNPDKVKAHKQRDYKANKKARITASRNWEKRNIEEVKVYKAEYAKKNRKKISARLRLRKHGMTQQEYDVLLRKQKNRCAICKKLFVETPDIDHCHKTEKNRGLLCSGCNVGLGQFKDSILFLKSAIKYLKGFVSAHA